MGLGKTPQAATALASVLDQYEGRALVICPASLRINWQRELETWCHGVTAEIALGASLPVSRVVIISYNALAKHHEALRKETWAVVIADEAHYMKTLDSQRTIEIRGGFGSSPIPCKYKWALTGTPMLNRPIELYPILKWLEVEFAKKEVLFGLRFCGGYAADFKGATNIPELREKLTGIMLRRLKADVLKELPAKTRQVIEVEMDAAGKAAIAEEKNELRKAGVSYEEIIASLDRPKVRLGSLEQGVIARIRKNTGLAKVQAAAEYILECLESVQKVIVFAHHKDVVAGLRAHLDDGLDGYGVELTGSTPTKDRQKAIDDFQNDPQCRVFIGNIQAAGVGLTLTAASLVIFVEQDWTPGANVQAEDRAHRFGQTDNVLVQYLVLNGSLDSYIARSVIAKQAVLDAILN